MSTIRSLVHVVNTRMNGSLLTRGSRDNFKTSSSWKLLNCSTQDTESWPRTKSDLRSHLPARDAIGASGTLIRARLRRLRAATARGLSAAPVMREELGVRLSLPMHRSTKSTQCGFNARKTPASVRRELQSMSVWKSPGKARPRAKSSSSSVVPRSRKARCWNHAKWPEWVAAPPRASPPVLFGRVPPDSATTPSWEPPTTSGSPQLIRMLSNSCRRCSSCSLSCSTSLSRRTAGHLVSRANVRLAPGANRKVSLDQRLHVLLRACKAPCEVIASK
mmetsp:Transcript_80835/g.187671  ORF Transcript_80835/g.187671 Transcript_80835/m.187671 type:complete len:276 (-) Transcript_80835:236-1063(-)